MKKLVYLALLVGLGALTPTASKANIYLNDNTAATIPITDAQQTAIAATTESGGLDTIAVRFVGIKVVPKVVDKIVAPVSCAAKSGCRLGAVTQGGRHPLRNAVADLKKRAENARHRGHRIHLRR